MSGIFIPEILRDCDFIGIEMGDGWTDMLFVSRDHAVVGGIVRVAATFKGKPIYTYSLYDPESRSVVHYQGTYGEPGKDEARSLDGAP